MIEGITIATLTPLLTFLSTAISIGIGGINLYQAFKGLVPTPKQRILNELVVTAWDEKAEVVENIYSALETAEQRVQQILKRLRLQYAAIVVVVLVVWILLLFSRFRVISFLSSANPDLINTLFILIGLLIAVYFYVWPSRFNVLRKKASDINKIIEAGTGDWRKKFKSIRNTKYLFPMSMSTAEGELVDAYLRLSTLVSTAEALLLKRNLNEAYLDLQRDIAYDIIIDLLTDSITRSISQGILEKPPQELNDRIIWVAKQRVDITGELQRLGLDYLIDSFTDDFFSYEYAKFNRKELRATLEKELATARRVKAQTDRENEEDTVRVGNTITNTLHLNGDSKIKDVNVATNDKPTFIEKLKHLLKSRR